MSLPKPLMLALLLTILLMPTSCDSYDFPGIDEEIECNVDLERDQILNSMREVAHDNNLEFNRQNDDDPDFGFLGTVRNRSGFIVIGHRRNGTVWIDLQSQLFHEADEADEAENSDLTNAKDQIIEDFQRICSI